MNNEPIEPQGPEQGQFSFWRLPDRDKVRILATHNKKLIKQVALLEEQVAAKLKGCLDLELAKLREQNQRLILNSKVQYDRIAVLHTQINELNASKSDIR